MEAGSNSKISLTAAEIRSFLANAFFLNTTDLAFFFGSQQRFIGSLDFTVLYSTASSVGTQRLLCQLYYFEQTFHFSSSDEDRLITFDRFVIDVAPDWDSDLTVISQEVLHVHLGPMEASSGRGFVDFANADLHIGSIIPSMTQEEVIFSCCPECFVGLLFCERFRDDEVMLISNIRRYSVYTGYLHTFQWAGPHPTQQLQDIVVIDANMENQYSRKMVRRDLNKAWKGFTLSPGTISTGHWGCGAFGGHKVLKFLQQLCAATVAHVTLDYSTFNDGKCAQELNHIFQMIVNGNLKVKDIYQIISEYDLDSAIEFGEFVKGKLNI